MIGGAEVALAIVALIALQAFAVCKSHPINRGS